jgi:hypothetical protein
MGRPRAPHGTRAAYKRHIALKERVCDACEAWRLGDRPESAKFTPPAVTNPADDAPEKPKEDVKERLRKIDPLEETLDNLDTIKAAIDWAKNNAQERLGPLSKRRSELIAEIISYGGKMEEAGERPKMEQLLDTPPSEVSDLGDNVIGFRSSATGA